MQEAFNAPVNYGAYIPRSPTLGPLQYFCSGTTRTPVMVGWSGPNSTAVQEPRIFYKYRSIQKDKSSLLPFHDYRSLCRPTKANSTMATPPLACSRRRRSAWYSGHAISVEERKVRRRKFSISPFSNLCLVRCQLIISRICLGLEGYSSSL